MSKLTLALLGSPTLQLDGQPLLKLRSRKAKALLIYLALTGQPQPREKLAGLFWGGFPEEKARSNLRGEIRRLRQMVGSHLAIGRFDVAFDIASDLYLDVVQFKSLLRQPEPTISEIETAVALYRGPFLADFYLPDAPEFDQWVEAQRENYRQMMIEALLQLSIHHTQQRQFDEALVHTQHLLHIEPWYEEAHRQMMLLLALDGQRGASLEQYHICARILKEEFGAEPGNATQELFQQIEAEEITAEKVVGVFVPLPVPYQAPSIPTHFVGRTVETEAIITAMDQSDKRQPVAFVGMGGIGKTTLAAAVAEQVKGAFPDGVLWANAASNDTAAIVESWARAYGLDFSSIIQSAQQAAALRGILTDKQALIIFDNVVSAEAIRPLLPANAKCQVFITTRNQEVAAALGAKAVLLPALQPAESLQLLAQILGDRAEKEGEAAQSLSAILHHLPLAIEIAAQLLSTRPRTSLTQMNARLRDVANQLDLRISDRAVRASFAVSWDALNDSLQRLFALSAIFAGRRFTADAIAHAGEMDSDEVEEGLYALSALSLVVEEGQIHYRQHPLLAAFAREKLGAADAVYGRMADYYLAYAQQNRQNYTQISQEWENLTVSIRTAYEQTRWQQVIDFVEALQDAWSARGRYHKAQQGYRWAVEAARALYDERALANCLLHWGKVCTEQGDYKTAAKHLTECLALTRRLADKPSTAAALDALAHVFLEQTKYDAAIQLLIESRQLWTDLGDAKGVAASLYWEGRVLSRTYAHEEVQAICQRALSIQNENGDLAGALQTLRLLARVAIFEEQYNLAQSYCQQSLTLCDALRDRSERANTLYTLSVVHTRKNELVKARQCLQESQDLFQRMGNQKMYGLTLHALSGVEDRQGNLDGALQANYQAREIFLDLGDQHNLVFVLLHRSKLHFRKEQLIKARQVCLEAIKFVREKDHPEKMNIEALNNQIEQKLADTSLV